MFFLQGPGMSGVPPSGGGFSPGQSQVSTQDQEKVGVAFSFTIETGHNNQQFSVYAAVSEKLVGVPPGEMSTLCCLYFHSLTANPSECHLREREGQSLSEDY